MKAQTSFPYTTIEEAVIKIMRKLPPERVSELVDFARFLEFRATEYDEDWVEAQSEEVNQAETTEQRWGELLAQPEAKRLMRQMAREAREDYHAGRSTEIVETQDGRLAPG